MRSAKYGTDVQSERKVKDMPGPGGGSRGGGFSGGGSRGGGFGGGFSGGGGHRGGGFSPRPPRPHFYGGWYHRPYHYGYGYHGGGCLGGLASIILVPILVLCISIVVIIGLLTSMITSLFADEPAPDPNADSYIYSEEVFQDYATMQYDTFYGNVPSSEYEEKLLLIFLTTEEMEEYHCIAWLGNEICTEINHLFGGAGSTFARVVQGNINSYYKYSLGSNLTAIVEFMRDEIEELNLSSSFRGEAAKVEPTDSKLVNYTSLNISPETVNDALADFTASTGIETVIVVEAEANVFEKYVPEENSKKVSEGDIAILVIMVALAALAVVAIVKNLRDRKKKAEREEDPYTKRPEDEQSNDDNW